MLRKSIEHGKEHRKPYKGSKDFAASCRNNGGCPYCMGNRLHKHAKRLQSLLDQEEENHNVHIPIVRYCQNWRE